MRSFVYRSVRRCSRLTWTTATALTALTAVMGAGAAQAELAVVSDGEQVWLVEPAQVEPAPEPGWFGSSEPGEREPALRVWHQAGEQRGRFTHASSLRQRQTMAAAASRQGNLWIAQPDGRVDHLRVRDGIVEQLREYEHRRLRSLGEDVHIRDLAAGRRGPWALVRVESRDALQRLDAWAPASQAVQNAGGGDRLNLLQPRTDHERRLRELVLGIPQGYELREPDVTAPTETEHVDAPIEAPPEQAQHEPPPEQETFQPVDRLLRWTGGRWEPVELPNDWGSTADQAWLVDGRADAMPRLVRAASNNDPPTLTVYDRLQSADDERAAQLNDSWRATTHPWQTAADQPLHVTAVGDWIVAGYVVQETEQQIELELAVLHGQGVLDLGRLAVQGENLDSWVLWSTGRTAALAAKGNADADEPAVWWSSIDLEGYVQRTSERFEFVERPGEGRGADYVLVIAVVVMSVLLLMTFWRRDVEAMTRGVPKGVLVGGVLPRFLAGLADLMPVLLLVGLFSGRSVAELVLQWPGQGMAYTWDAMLPGLAAIALFIAYTTIAELATGRTLGKAFMGLEVIGLDGERPGKGQILVRNLLKAFDLIAVLLLLLIILSPLRQRLGDMVARTVVVQREREKDADGHSDE